MSEPKGNCPNCKNEVEFVRKGSSLYCPVCWHTFEQTDIAAQTENRKEDLGSLTASAVRVILMLLLVLAGIFLVFLAFVYAACSHMGNI